MIVGCGCPQGFKRVSPPQPQTDEVEMVDILGFLVRFAQYTVGEHAGSSRPAWCGQRVFPDSGILEARFAPWLPRWPLSPGYSSSDRQLSLRDLRSGRRRKVGGYAEDFQELLHVVVRVFAQHMLLRGPRIASLHSVSKVMKVGASLSNEFETCGLPVPRINGSVLDR
jgi:hypothetical protein